MLTWSDTQKRILTKMFVHANEENNERQTAKLKERAKQNESQGGMEGSWMRVALSNMHTNTCEALEEIVSLHMRYLSISDRISHCRDRSRTESVREQGLSELNWTHIK